MSRHSDNLQGDAVLCGANAYEEKYYFNPRYEKLPENIKKELNIICVLFTQEVGGIFTIGFDEEGQVLLSTLSEEEDITYDEISAGLLTGKIYRERKEMFHALSLYYRILVLGEPESILAEDDEVYS